MDEIKNVFPNSRYTHPHGSIIVCIRTGELVLKRFRINRWEIEDPKLLKDAIKKISKTELNSTPNNIKFKIWVNIKPEEYKTDIKSDLLEVVLSKMFISLFDIKYFKDFYVDDDKRFTFLERMAKYAI